MCAGTTAWPRASSALLKRAGLPHRLRHQITGKTRRHPLHRGLLQQPPSAFSPRLPPTQRSPLQLPPASHGSLEKTTKSAVRNHRSSSHSASPADRTLRGVMRYEKADVGHYRNSSSRRWIGLHSNRAIPTRPSMCRRGQLGRLSSNPVLFRHVGFGITSPYREHSLYHPSSPRREASPASLRSDIESLSTSTYDFVKWALHLKGHRW